MDAKVVVTKLAIKEKVKNKSWKNLSSSEKDELLEELCKKHYLI